MNRGLLALVGLAAAACTTLAPHDGFRQIEFERTEILERLRDIHRRGQERRTVRAEGRLKLESPSASGHVEVDETFIGGKARFMHKDKREQKIKGTGGMGKVAVMGLLERHGPHGHSVVRAKVVDGRRRAHLDPEVRRHVESGSQVYSDALPSYDGLSDAYIHGVIDHAEAYVDGQIHTNGCENFWSLLKRALKGTYVSVEPFHLFRYLDEQVYKFNNRLGTDADRFVGLVRSVVGRRVTFAELTGATTTPA